MAQEIDEEISKDITALQAYRQYRIDFIDEIAVASSVKSQDVLSILRADSTFQIAEFFFLIAGFNIVTADQFDHLIERHNAYVSQLLKDKPKMARMGLSEERLLNAIFDGETRPRVLKIWTDEPGSIDQTSLGRLLVGVMSDETARKTVVACAKAGLLKRQNSVYRLTLVKSTGKLEEIYGRCLRMVRKQVQALD